LEGYCSTIELHPPKPIDLFFVAISSFGLLVRQAALSRVAHQNFEVELSDWGTAFVCTPRRDRL
jgi:hypothetical protein